MTLALYYVSDAELARRRVRDWKRTARLTDEWRAREAEHSRRYRAAQPKRACERVGCNRPKRPGRGMRWCAECAGAA